MNRKSLLVISVVAWAGTLFGAYFLGKSGSGEARAEARNAMVGEAAGSGGKLTALGAAEREGDSDDSTRSGLGSGNALQMLKNSLSSRNPVERMSSFMAALALMDEDDFPLALDELKEELRAGENQREIGLLLYAWAEKDGASALGYLDELELGRQGWTLYSSALTAWGSADPAEAEVWALNKHQGKEGNDNWYMLGVIKGVVENDVTNAARLAEEIGFGRARGEALGTVVDELFKQGDEAAMNWIESLGGEDERFRGGAAGRVAARIASSDPQAAAKWVIGLSLADEQKGSAIESVASQWGRESPVEAVAWASQLDDPDLRSQGMASVVDRWARNDADAAGTWLGTMPASPELDRPVRTYAYRVRERDPGAAITWANTITDEKMRSETVSRIGGEWLRKNPEEANTFFQGEESVPEGLQRFLK